MRTSKKICASLVFFTVICFSLYQFSYSYFSKRAQEEQDAHINVNLLFDTLASPTNPESTWGTSDNPYVISSLNHLKNLNYLQNSGYFTRNNTQPYFQVSTRDGGVVTIAADNGSSAMTPIGTEENPFNGTFTGVTINEEASTIKGIQISATDGTTDIGLFGKVSGATIHDLLLEDIQINATAEGTIDFAHGSLFGEDASERETNHVGILAGHIESSTVNNISVYYTKNTTNEAVYDALTIDAPATADYVSANGIIGYYRDLRTSESSTGVTSGGGDGGGGGGGESDGSRGVFSADYIAEHVGQKYTYDATTNKVTFLDESATEYEGRYLNGDRTSATPLLYKDGNLIRYNSIVDSRSFVHLPNFGIFELNTPESIGTYVAPYFLNCVGQTNVVENVTQISNLYINSLQEGVSYSSSGTSGATLENIYYTDRSKKIDLNNPTNATTDYEKYIIDNIRTPENNLMSSLGNFYLLYNLNWNIGSQEAAYPSGVLNGVSHLAKVYMANTMSFSINAPTNIVLVAAPSPVAWDNFLSVTFPDAPFNVYLNITRNSRTSLGYLPFKYGTDYTMALCMKSDSVRAEETLYAASISIGEGEDFSNGPISYSVFCPYDSVRLYYMSVGAQTSGDIGDTTNIGSSGPGGSGMTLYTINSIDFIYTVADKKMLVNTAGYLHSVTVVYFDRLGTNALNFNIWRIDNGDSTSTLYIKTDTSIVEYAIGTDSPNTVVMTSY